MTLFEHSGSTNTVANIVNRKALFDYYIEEKHEAGLVLEGWEVKSIREGRAQIKEAHVIIPPV